MNNFLKTIELPQNEQKIEYDYIEDIYTFEGKLKYCNLCNVYDNDIREHLKSDNHKKLVGINKNEPFEDILVAHKMHFLSQTDEELNTVSSIVIACEQALKHISDEMHGIKNCENLPDNFKNDENIVNSEKLAESTEEKDEMLIMEDEKDDGIDVLKNPRLLKGVMRSGLLANGLLMKGETDVHLVIISSSRPTHSLLHEIKIRLSDAIKTLSETSYNIIENTDECYIKVETTDQSSIHASCFLHLTSVQMRKHPFHKFNELNENDSEDILNEKYCSTSLQILRRARWFDSKVYNLSHCEAVLKILRNLIQTDPIWKPLNYWSLQLIVYRALSSCMDASIRSSTALLRVFEMLASGYLLINGPGLYDPCEKELNNLCDLMTIQEKEDITYYSQKAIRLISSRHINQILDLPDDISIN